MGEVSVPGIAVLPRRQEPKPRNLTPAALGSRLRGSTEL